MLIGRTENKIKKLQSIEPIDEKTFMVKYLFDDGLEDVSIIPKEITEREIKELFDYTSNPKKLFEIPSGYGQMWHGEIQSSNINSISCKEFNERLLDYLNLLYKFVEIQRANIYIEMNNGKYDYDGLQQIENLEKQCKQILETNADLISPIWKKKSNIYNYYGTSLEGIYGANTYYSSEYKLKHANTIEYCLASGVRDISGIYDYGGYGGVLSYSFIYQLYGEKAANEYKNNAIECSETFDYVDSLHNHR